MLIFKKRNLSATPLYTAIIVIVLMAGGLGGYSAITKYKNYINTKEIISDKYNTEYQNRLVEEMSVIIDFIDYKQKLSAINLENQLQQKVQIAYVTASHIYSFNKGNLPEDTIKTMIIETLRPIRWDTNQGYYFIGDASSGRSLLQANDPSMEGAILYDMQDPDGEFVIRNIIATVSERGAGLVTYKWNKPGETSVDYLKSSFVKYFMPYNWYIGAGIYLDEIQYQLQSDVLQRIRDMKFARFGSVACIRSDGQTLVDFENTKDGRLVETIKDDAGSDFGREIIAIFKTGDRKGFVKSMFYKPGTNELTQRLSYIQYFEEWNWILITSMFEDEMIAAITAETEKFRQSTVKDLGIFASIFLVTVTGVFAFAFYYSRRLEDDISLFTDFFRQSAYHKIPLEDKNLAFNEFHELGEFANKMVEERTKADNLVLKDKLRFNSLYQISKMQDLPVQEVCKFALERTLKLSESEAGYICLLKDKEARADVICMRIERDSEKVQIRDFTNVKLDKNTTAYIALQQKKTIKDNESAYEHLIDKIFGGGGCTTTLDVPITDGEKVVAVAGVCNKSAGPYDEFDEQQLAIVYEGVWHHLIRERNEKEKLRLRNLLESINDSMSSMIIGVDKNCRVIQWNRQTEIITGIAESQAAGQPVDILLPRIKNLIPKIQQVINDGEPKEVHNAEYHAKDMKRFEDISVYPLVGTLFHGAVIRIDDVTEKVRMEDMMMQSEKMLSVGGLAAGMAHEINNPLAGIVQNLQVARKRLTNQVVRNRKVAEELDIDLEKLELYMKERKVDAMFDSIASSAERAGSLVSNMLSFSRKSDSVFTSTDIIDLMEKTIDLVSKDYDLKKNYDFKKIRLIRQFDDGLPLIPCEQQNIQQVFFNILKNGAQALHEKSFRGTEPQIVISIQHIEGTIQIAIEDNGPGIDSELVKRIFEPFFTTKPVGIGTGLGLSISYFIINEQHRGSIEVNSSIGEGTRFMIKLPCVRDITLSAETMRIG